MSRTFLTHITNGCGGSVVIDCDKAVKLIAPSFSINSNGIGSLMMDIEVVPEGRFIPSFRCKRCNQVIGHDTIGTDVSCICQICGKSFPVSEIHVHSEIVSICSPCIREIKEFHTSGEAGIRVKEFIGLYALTKAMRTVPLVTVLDKPIII